MIIHKFGGASLKDATSIKKLSDRTATFSGQAIVVVSAIGKTTNALENLVALAYAENKQWQGALNRIETDHLRITDALFSSRECPATKEIQHLFNQLRDYVNSDIHLVYNKLYDGVVSFGERFSSTIVRHFFHKQHIIVEPISALEIIFTDTTFREAKIDWKKTEAAVKKRITSRHKLYITEGFIGSNGYGIPTTLGREGSDFSAAILGNILNAKEVRIWKDVDGLYNADPKQFPEAILLPRVSYRECVELGYYGARVIHPRTILPLQRKSIPLYIQSFLHPERQGTLICSHTTEVVDIPCFIIKNNQCLITLTPLNLGFMAEEYVEEIIGVLKTHGIRVNLLQSSAVNLTVCFDYDAYRFVPLRRELEKGFELRFNTGLELLTISNYNEECLKSAMAGKKILLTQKSRRIIRMVYINP